LTRSPLTAKRTDAVEAKTSTGKNSTDADLRATGKFGVARTKIGKGKTAKSKTEDPRLLKKGIRMERLSLKKLSVPSFARERAPTTNLRYKALKS